MNGTPWHKCGKSRNRLKDFEPLSYGKPYITLVNLHKSRGGMGGIPMEVLILSSNGSARCIAQGLQQGCVDIY